MKAVVLNEVGGPEKLTIQDVDTPEPAGGEVRVNLKHSALNRRDYWITVGKYPGLVLPCITGSDGAGIVDAVGEDVDSGLIGKEVVIYPARAWGDDQRFYGKDFRVLGMPDQGTFAEYICVPATDVQPKPAHLMWAQAAAMPLGGLTSWRAVVTHGEVGPGQRVLVTAAGSGVSSFAILWALNLGAEVYVTSGSDEKIEKTKTLGVAGGINYREEDCFKKLVSKAGRFDVIVDSAGGDGLNALLDTLKPAGRYVFYGATLGNPTKGLQMPKLFFRHIRLQGTTMGSPEEFRTMLEFVAENRIEPVIDRVLPMDQAVEAHQLMENFGQTGKIVLQNE